MNDLRRRQERLDRARTLAHFELLVAFAGLVLAIFLYVAAPGFSRGYRPEGSWIFDLVPSAVVILGFAGIILGIVAMVRIYRADAEPDERRWRYRRF